MEKLLPSISIIQQYNTISSVAENINDIQLKVEHIILKYLKLNCHLLRESHFLNQTTDEIECGFFKWMVGDLNKIGVKKSKVEWTNHIRAWTAKVKEKLQDHENFSFSNEEINLLLIVELLNHKWVEPTTTELTIILEHLENFGNNLETWSLVSSKIQSTSEFSMPDSYWKSIYSTWVLRTQTKKNLFNLLVREPVQKNIFQLLELECRLIDYLEHNPEETIKIVNLKNDDSKVIQLDSCRICLQNVSASISLFSDLPNSNITLIEKISQCTNVTIVKNDGWPENICSKCLQLVEQSFYLKVMCEKNDTEMRNLHTFEYYKESFSKETIIEFYETHENSDCTEELLDVKSHLDEDEQEIEASFVEAHLESKAINIVEEHKIKITNANVTNTTPVYKEKNESLSRQCDTCGRIFGTSRRLKTHIKTHSENKDHICDFCHKKFKTNLSLKVHLRCHTGERPYVCEVCGKRFSQTGALSGHRKIHKDEKNYPCNLCNYRAITRQVLKIHERKHTGNKPYDCDMCNSKFSTASNLRKHKQRRHMGLKDFKKCGKAFKTVSAINNHRASHSIEKNFLCQHCPYRANTKATLKVHDRTHSGVQPYKCSTCAAKFSTASNLLKHVRNIHDKMKLHKCDQCDRSFFSKESARKHMVTHSGIKPYSCKECSLTYSWYNGLQKHYRQQHPNDDTPKERSFFEKTLNLI